MTTEERSARERTTRMLRERIAYHAARAREEEGWVPPEDVDDVTDWMLRDRIAYHEAKAREEERGTRP